MTKKNENDVEIIFLVTTDRHDGTGKTFNEGDKRTMNLASANHWINRNKAITVADHEAAEKAEEDAKKTSAATAKAHDKESAAALKAEAKATKKAEKKADK